MGFRPSQGFSVSREELTSGSQFVALGPLSEGDVVRRVVVHVQVHGVVAWRFGASLGVSPQGSQAALRSGRSLISVSDVPALNGDQGHPHIGWTATQAGYHVFEMFPGLRVSGPSGWIQTHTLFTPAPGGYMFVAFEIWRVVRAGRRGRDDDG